MLIRPLIGIKSGVLAILAAISATPVLAQEAHFGKLTISPGFPPSAGTESGNTGGSYSLSAIANRDRDGNPCVGFADPKPDHILVLKKDFPHLKIQVNSNKPDASLVVQNDDQEVRCSYDSVKNNSVAIDSNWKAGRYRIWVGAPNPGQQLNYTLSVQE
jgi:hypothetical protein